MVNKQNLHAWVKAKASEIMPRNYNNIHQSWTSYFTHAKTYFHQEGTVLGRLQSKYLLEAKPGVNKYIPIEGREDFLKDNDELALEIGRELINSFRQSGCHVRKPSSDSAWQILRRAMLVDNNIQHNLALAKQYDARVKKAIDAWEKLETRILTGNEPNPVKAVREYEAMEW